jgi:hypothetical protein
MKYVLVVIGTLFVLVVGYVIYLVLVANPRVEREIREDPNGDRARKVMLITLPSAAPFP